MVTFTDLWRLLYDHGSSNYYKHDCNQIFESLEPARRQRLYDNIDGKLRAGKFVSFNPLEAIHDNMPRKLQPKANEPTNYNGARSFPDEPLVIAKYGNAAGIYTLREAKLYGMQIIKPFNP